MFFLFFCFISSEIISITQDNVNDTISSNSSSHYFTWFWSPYCSHCRDFRPTWEYLLNNSRFLNKINFADINCIQYHDICQNFNINGYPTLLWITPVAKSRIEFTGAHKFEQIELFIQKQYQFPITALDKKEEISEFINQTNTSSLFLLTYDGSSTDVIEAFRQISIDNRKSTARFFTVDGEKNELIVYREKNSFIKYEGDFLEKSIRKFVSDNLFPYLSPLSNEAFEDSRANGTLIMIFVVVKEDDYERFSHIVKSMPSGYHYCYIDDPDNYIVNYIGIKKQWIPSVSLINVKKNQWRHFNGLKTFENLNKFIKESNEKAKWDGPGDGLFSKFFEQMYSLKAQGGILLVVISLLAIFVVVLISFVVVDMIHDGCFGDLKQE